MVELESGSASKQNGGKKKNGDDLLWPIREFLSRWYLSKVPVAPVEHSELHALDFKVLLEVNTLVVQHLCNAHNPEDLLSQKSNCIRNIICVLVLHTWLRADSTVRVESVQTVDHTLELQDVEVQNSTKEYSFWQAYTTRRRPCCHY